LLFFTLRERAQTGRRQRLANHNVLHCLEHSVHLRPTQPNPSHNTTRGEHSASATQHSAAQHSSTAAQGKARQGKAYVVFICGARDVCVHSFGVFVFVDVFELFGDVLQTRLILLRTTVLGERQSNRRLHSTAQHSTAQRSAAQRSAHVTTTTTTQPPQARRNSRSAQHTAHSARGEERGRKVPF
jgi:hypothetical protein